MKNAVLAMSLLVASCGGGQAPTITHATIVRALKFVCSAVQGLSSDDPPPPQPAPTSGGEVPPT